MTENNKKLSIRNKTMYIVLFSCVFFLAVFYFIASSFLLKSFISLEKSEVIRNLDRVEFSIEKIISNQSTKLKDWAYWNDTYEFILDKNKAYIESNLTNSTLSSLQINTMIFLNTKDEVVYSKFVDIETSEDLNQDNLLSFIKSNIDSIKDLSQKDNINNIIKIPEGEMMISVDQILKSDKSGISRGTIIFGSFLTSKVEDNISGLVRFPIKLYSYNSYIDSTDVIIAKGKLTKSNEHYFNVNENDLAYGYTLLHDIQGNPVYIVKVEIPRDIYKQGKNTIYSFMLIIFFSILIFGVIILILLEKFIIKRIIKLEKEVEYVNKDEDFSNVLDENINDEIGGLSVSINKMLRDVIDAKKKEINMNKEQEIINKNIKLRAEETEKINRLMVNRELRMIELKKENIRLKEENEKS